MLKFIKNAKPVDWKIGNDCAMIVGGLFMIVSYFLNLKDDVNERKQLTAAENGDNSEELSEDTISED